jgi:hypothetical protein
MNVLNLENAKWLIATLAIPAALAFVAHGYQQSQAERQINDARLRLYTELLSKREEADTAVRRGIFDKVLERYLAPGDQGLQAKLVALELLATNFHDSLDLSPLFWQIGREVERAPKNERTSLSHELMRIADGVKDRQISGLELGSGAQGQASKLAGLRLDALTTENGKPDIDADFSFPDPDPFAPRGRTLTRHLKLWITAHDAPRRRVWAIVDARANQGEKDQRWVFWIDTFDFPMVNFTRVSRSERFTVVLQEYEPESVKAKVRLIYFPSARVGAKDKPFIDDVISDLVHERK